MTAEISNSVSGIKFDDTDLNNHGGDDGDDDVVNPWNVVSKSETGVDYDKLISKHSSFKCVNASKAHLTAHAQSYISVSCISYL